MVRVVDVVESVNSLKVSLEFPKKDIKDFIEACKG